MDIRKKRSELLKGGFIGQGYYTDHEINHLYENKIESRKKTFRNVIYKRKADDFEWQEMGDYTLVNRYGQKVNKNSLGSYMYSVERIKDGERFTLGDVVMWNCLSKVIHEMYETDENRIEVYFYGGDKAFLSEIEDKSDIPLFNTEDDYDVYPNEVVYEVYEVDNDFNINGVKARKIFLNKFVYGDLKAGDNAFKYLINAEEYIIENKMKVLFLDIDGVLNSNQYFKSKTFDNREAEMGYPYSHFDTVAIHRLNKITDATGVKIVLSTSWRGMSDTVEVLYSVGLKGNIIGSTPYLDLIPKARRGDEIQKWLDTHEVEDYVILDDDPDMLDSQKDNFFQTDYKLGLTTEIANQIIEKLND